MRDVYVAQDQYPFFKAIRVEFVWFGGFAPSQKRKCELGLYLNFSSVYPDEKYLEVSGKSLNPLGPKLSAMNLKKKVELPTGEIKETAVESAY